MKKLTILLIAITMLFGVSVVVSAATSISGTLYYRFEGNSSSAQNNSKVDFFRISVATDKTFGDDKANAYLTLQCQTFLTEPDNPEQRQFNWNIYQYGYTYNLSDRWAAGIMYDTEGVALSNGQLCTSWEWLREATGELNSNNIVKLVGSPLDTLSTGIYVDPMTRDYVIKGEFKISGLKIGAGYTNLDETYNIYTEIIPVENGKIYLDYLSNGKYLFDSSIKFEPITITLTHSNQDRLYLCSQILIFKANTADLGVNYAFDAKNSLTGGIVYNTYFSDLDALYAKYNFDRGYVGVKQDSTLTAALSQTHINAGYRIDGTNLLEADYNATSGAWWIAMAVYL